MSSPETPYPVELAELSGEQTYLDDDKPRSECGVFGVYAPGSKAAWESYYALHQMTHRGHESAGIAVVHDGRIQIGSGDGEPVQVFDKAALDGLPGEIGIGHNRYSTTGESSKANEHPFLAEGPLGEVALSHNGNLTNIRRIRQWVETRGITPEGTTDSELAAYVIAHAGGQSWEDNIHRFMDLAEGAYSMAMLTKDALYAFRDPHGVRPLYLAQTEGGWAVGSETTIFRSLQYHPYRAIAPGEVVRINGEDLPKTVEHRPDSRQALCLFEYIYFSAPASELEGKRVNRVRKDIGRQLAREAPADVDVVFGVPESGTPMALGFADQNDYKYEPGLQKGWGSRTFIDPRDKERLVEMKFNPFPEVVGGKRVCIVDDSLVRGNTMPNVVRMVRRAGATEVHVRIGCPPLIDTCHMGVNISERSELLAAQEQGLDAIQGHLGVNSLAYVSLQGVLAAAERDFSETCTACLTRVYPFKVKDKRDAYAVSDSLAAAPNLFRTLNPRDRNPRRTG